MININRLNCPRCGSTAIELVETLAPETQEEATKGAYIGGVGGAALGGGLGSVFGPAGTAIGASIGALLGGAAGADEGNKQIPQEATIQCQECGFQGRAEKFRN